MRIVKKALLSLVLVTLTPLALAHDKTKVIKKGDAIQHIQPTAITSVLSSPQQYEKKQIALEGVVERVCEKKGCWLQLQTENKQGIRITFKDYGFFVPTNILGSKIHAEGLVKTKQLTEKERKHLVEDGASIKPKQPFETFFVANALEIYPQVDLSQKTHGK